METDRSPGLPSLMVTTRRRLMPQGTSFSFLHAVTHALQSMQRSASHKNFIRAMFPLPLCRSDLTERALRLLHASGRVEAIGGEGIHALAKYVRIGTFGIFAALIDALEPARKVKGHPGHALADALRHQRFHPCL